MCDRIKKMDQIFDPYSFAYARTVGDPFAAYLGPPSRLRMHKYVKTVEPAWLDKASWRFVFLNSPLWNQIPVEIYQHIDSLFLEKMFKCIQCQRVFKTRDQSFCV